jgi:hypothetical protein
MGHDPGRHHHPRYSVEELLRHLATQLPDQRLEVSYSQRSPFRGYSP